MSVLASLGGLLAGTAILLLGQGLFLLLVPLRLGQSGFSPSAVSLVVSAYFAGFVIGGWHCSRLIRSVGHIRAYAGLIATVVVAALSLPLLPGLVTWTMLRALYGAAAAGAFLTIESWLNTAAPRDRRGRVFAIYTVLSLAAIGSGQLLVNLFGVGFEAFNVGAILLALSIVPVALSRIVGPTIGPIPKRSQVFLIRHSPLSTVTSFSGGRARRADVVWLTAGKP